MSQVERQELEKFRSFYHQYCQDDIARLAQRYPNEQRSLYVAYNDLFAFDADLAERYLNKPEDMQEIAEEALRTYDLPADVSLGQAHVRVRGLPSSSTIDIRNIRVVDDHIGSMVAVRGIVRKATDVRPKIVEAAFECQRCGTMTYIPQSDSGFQEPHECQGCERQGPFRINHDQSEFIDAQTLRIQESPEGLRGGETPQSIDVYLEDDICGAVTPGDHVNVAGVLHIEQQTSGNEKTALFDLYMDGVTVTIEDEEFEDMDIDDEDVTEILELADSPDIYERMVDSVAPSIYGYREEKLAMILQLFSGVTKHLPDESRIRGDLHMLLIGDPGTGKCVRGDTPVTLADGSEEPIRELVESNLDDPDPVDDGVYDDADFTVPSLSADGNLVERQATRVWKREAPEELVRIETASGREIEVTPSHPLFVSAGGGFEARRASELDEGSFVATPRTVPSGGGNEIEATYRESESPNAVRLNLPDEWTPQLARLVGYIVAEGYVSLNDDNTGSIFLTNNDQEVLDDAGDALESLGLNYTVRDPHEGKDAREIICTGGEFISFLKNLEPALLKGSSEQQVPEPIFTASDGIRRAFLRAYIEGEGHVSTTQRSVTVASTSRKLLEDVRSLLLSFGIGTSLEERNNGSYRLHISGENFRRFRGEIGLITERKSEALTQFDSVETNTNTDVVPNVGEELERIRTQVGLSQFDCGVPRTTYQHYERGDRQPSRESLVKILDTFEERLDWLRRSRDRLAGDDWDVFEVIRNELNVSQSELASATSVSQGAISGYERGDVVPDGGVTTEASQRLVEEIDSALGVETAVKSLRHLVEGDVRWDKITTIERIDHDEDWVYDLEVEGTHSYVSNGIVSHNSQLLSYVRNIAPRSVYTSGKGSSSAGLCVTGDTLVHTTEGIRRVEDLVTPEIPEAVDTETAAEREYDVYTYDEDAEETRVASTSHVWRMPERQCRRIETAAGEEVEASTNTPVLTCGDEGPEWTEISEVEAGDYVATPKFDGLDRSSPEVGSVVDADLRWDEVVAAVDTGEKEVYDLTVPETNNFVANGVVTHNTAAAVQDDFGDGQQWTLEAGALVLADKGIAAVDELDKMAADDRSAMHEALEQQSVSISKAGINATLKSRCSLLGAANPKYGRFDQYEPIGEQIDLEPALISRFDLIFTVTDQPDPDHDARLAEHILTTNYAGELNTQKTQMTNSEITQDEVNSVQEEVAPDVDADLLRKYVAYSKRNCYPRMSDEAREAIQEFYVDLRAEGADEDAPVPVTARKLEALVRLAEASARVRLSDEVSEEDAERVIEIVRSCLEDIGIDPETGEFDADVVETGQSKTQRDRVKNLKQLLRDIDDEYDSEPGAPRDRVYERADEIGMDHSRVEDEIEKLKTRGDIYFPDQDHIKVV